MSFKVEAAVITRKGVSTQFNSDSININKKVLPREVSANGYKGAGAVVGKSFFALADARVESCADAAVVSLNERSEQFLLNSADVQNIFSDFFKDITGALTEMGHNSSAFSCALFYIDEQEVVISQTGSVKCFRYSQEKLYFVDPILEDHSDALSQYGSSRFDDVKDGDLFFLLDENVANALNNELLESICKQCEGNTKVAVKLLLSKVDTQLNAGAFVLKVSKDEEEVSSVAVKDAESEEKLIEIPINSENESDEDAEEEKNEKSGKKSLGYKVAVVLITAVLMVGFFIGGVYVGRYLRNFINSSEYSQSDVEESQAATDETAEATQETTDETTVDESTTDETTVEKESTTQDDKTETTDSVQTTVSEEQQSQIEAQ